MMPKISVITVTYNCVDVVESTIRSVLGQSYDNIEYLIIDGGSNDGTLDIIKKYSDSLSFWCSEADKGIYDAMNKGLKFATGEWINFMNAGDTFHNENVVESIFSEKSPCYSTLPALRVIGGNTNNVHTDHSWIHYAESAGVIPVRLPFSHQSCFMKKPFVFDLRYRLAADYKVLYDLYYQCGEKVFEIVDIVIADYLKEGSFSTTNARLAKCEYLRIQSAHPTFRWIKEVAKYIFKMY